MNIISHVLRKIMQFEFNIVKGLDCVSFLVSERWHNLKSVPQHTSTASVLGKSCYQRVLCRIGPVLFRPFWLIVSVNYYEHPNGLG